MRNNILHTVYKDEKMKDEAVFYGGAVKNIKNQHHENSNYVLMKMSFIIHFKDLYHQNQNCMVSEIMVSGISFA